MRQYLLLFLFCVSDIMAQNQPIVKQALLVMDMQETVFNTLPANAQTIIDQVYQAIAHARKNSIPVIYVKAEFRPELPEINPLNKFFSANKDNYARVPQQAWRIVERIAPATNDIVVNKHRISAFQGTDLEMILKAKGIMHLVLTGVSTSGVVLSTVREAADKDYQITVISDGCADRDDEVQRVLLTKVFPRQAEVITLNDWINK